MDTVQRKSLSTADIAGAGVSASQTRPEEQHVRDDDRDTKLQEAYEECAPLFAQDVRNDLKARWASIQSSFIDDPRQAVRQGDELVAQVMKSLAETFANERSMIEAKLDRQDKDTDTEDLRLTLRRYRSFFDRLLSF